MHVGTMDEPLAGALHQALENLLAIYGSAGSHTGNCVLGFHAKQQFSHFEDPASDLMLSWALLERSIT
jgi:hypothetical protein